jgi:hypothetical protein
MGKRVTVKSGYTDVMLPQAVGLQPFNSGQTADLTDAEYTALSAAPNTATLNALNATTTTIPDPARPSIDPQVQPLNAVTYASGVLQLKIGLNVVTLNATVGAGNLKFPVVPAGSASQVDVVFIQGTGGSKLITAAWAGSGAKFSGGTATVLSTTAGAVDRLQFLSRGDGATWDCLDSLLAMA